MSGSIKQQRRQHQNKKNNTRNKNELAVETRFLEWVLFGEPLNMQMVNACLQVTIIKKSSLKVKDEVERKKVVSLMKAAFSRKEEITLTLEAKEMCLQVKRNK